MLTFRKIESKNSQATMYASDDGRYKIIKRPDRPGYEVRERTWTLKCKYPSLEMALYQLKGRLIK